MNTIPRSKIGKDFVYDGFEEDEDNHRRQASDPVVQSNGSKPYNLQSKFVAQIDRELRLRTGAEKLLKATSNQRLKDQILMELNLANSNLQTMKENLLELDSFHIVNSLCYHDGQCFNTTIPMIVPGLKETKDVDYHSMLKETIVVHYHEEVNSHKSHLDLLTDMRKACVDPQRNEEGIAKLFIYYNQLYFVDRRFFPASKNGPGYFYWFDSFTGAPTSQRTIGFEKGSWLFNIATLYAQKAIKLLRSGGTCLLASEDFRRSAGAFRYLHDNFSHAPSFDMQEMTTDVLIHLMLTQSRECLLQSSICDDVMLTNSVVPNVKVAQETANVSIAYSRLMQAIQTHAAQKGSQFPAHWLSVARCKQQYYFALSHFHIATALVAMNNSAANLQTFSGVYSRVDASRQKLFYSETLTKDADGRRILALAHLRSSILANEEAIKIANKERQKLHQFHNVLKQCHSRSLSKFLQLEEEDDFSEHLVAPNICGKSALSVEPLPPDFVRYKVEDLFHDLGCIAIFSARHHWTAPRSVVLTKSGTEEFGFSIRGDSPVIVATVDDESLAQAAGMLVGDFIIAVDNINIKWTKHEKVVALIRTGRNVLTLRLITPMDHNYIDPTNSPASSSQKTTPTSGQTCNGSGNEEQKSKKGNAGTS